MSATGTNQGLQDSHLSQDRVQITDDRDYRDEHTIGGYASRVRGGSVWGGAAVGLGTLLLLELILLTTGLSGASLHVNGKSGGSFAWDAVAAAISFFLAGLVAGASSSNRDANTGTLNGIVTWAAIIVGTIIISGSFGSSVFGAISNVVTSQQQSITNAANNVQVTQSTVNTFRDTAGWAALSGAITLALAALGGLLGSRMGARRTLTTNSTRS